MSSTPKILMQLDSDTHASAFDAIVALDSDVQQLLPYANVEPIEVRDLVYGAIFTRGPALLKNTAIFVGGTDVDRGEALLAHVQKAFIGPLRVSVMFDGNGANTTAAAAVIAVARHVTLGDATVVVLGSTGPVGLRVMRLLARAGAVVRAGSRNQQRAAAACARLAESVGPAAGERLIPVVTETVDELRSAIEGAGVVIACGSPGVELLPAMVRNSATGLRVAIDLNAVPPLGIEGLNVTDKAVTRQETVCYGAVGVGETKMRIHRAALRRLFTQNDLVLDAEEIFDLAVELER